MGNPANTLEVFAPGTIICLSIPSPAVPNPWYPGCFGGSTAKSLWMALQNYIVKTRFLNGLLHSKEKYTTVQSCGPSLCLVWKSSRHDSGYTSHANTDSTSSHPIATKFQTSISGEPMSFSTSKFTIAAPANIHTLSYMFFCFITLNPWTTKITKYKSNAIFLWVEGTSTSNGSK